MPRVVVVEHTYSVLAYACTNSKHPLVGWSFTNSSHTGLQQYDFQFLEKLVWWGWSHPLVECSVQVISS